MSLAKTNLGPLGPSDIICGATYKIRTGKRVVLAELSGPWRDSGSEFFIAETPDGGFDIEYRGRGVWYAGPDIGELAVFEGSRA